MKDALSSGEVSQRLTSIASEYQSLKRQDREGAISLGAFIDRGLELAAERCDILAGQNRLTIGTEYRDALTTVLASGEYETAYQWGYNGGSQVHTQKATAEVNHLGKLITEQTGTNLVHSPLAADLIQPQISSRYSSYWRAIEENMRRANISDGSRAIVALIKLSGQGYHQTRTILDKLHDPTLQFTAPNKEQFWRNRLCPEKREGLAFYRGYTYRLMTEARQLSDMIHPELDTEQMFQLWSVICFLDSGSLYGKYKEVQSFRPDVFSLLDQGDTERAEAILKDVAIVCPDAFSHRLLRYLEIDRNDIPALQKARRTDSSGILDQYRTLSAAHRDALRRQQIAQAEKRRAELTSPEVVEEVSHLVGKLFYAWGNFTDSDSPEPAIYEISKVSSRTIRTVTVLPDGTIGIMGVRVPMVYHRYYSITRGAISVVPSDNGFTYPGAVLEALRGEHPSIWLIKLPLTKEQLTKLIDKKVPRTEVYQMVMKLLNKSS